MLFVRSERKGRADSAIVTGNDRKSKVQRSVSDGLERIHPIHNEATKGPGELIRAGLTALPDLRQGANSDAMTSMAGGNEDSSIERFCPVLAMLPISGGKERL